MALAEDIKSLLSGAPDERLEVIEKRTRERLLVIIGSNLKEVPSELDYIVMDVVLKRFNRIGQEGMQSYSQEGLSMTFAESDFDEFIDDIKRWKTVQDENVKNKNGRFTLY
nr:MAG TPA: Head Tail Connector Protein [Caudoviricetes sp.]